MMATSEGHIIKVPIRALSPGFARTTKKDVVKVCITGHASQRIRQRLDERYDRYKKPHEARIAFVERIIAEASQKVPEERTKDSVCTIYHCGMTWIIDFSQDIPVVVTTYSGYEPFKKEVSTQEDFWEKYIVLWHGYVRFVLNAETEEFVCVGSVAYHIQTNTFGFKLGGVKRADKFFSGEEKWDVNKFRVFMHTIREEFEDMENTVRNKEEVEVFLRKIRRFVNGGYVYCNSLKGVRINVDYDCIDDVDIDDEIDMFLKEKTRLVGKP